MTAKRLPLAIAALALLTPALAGCMEKAAQDDAITPDAKTPDAGVGLTPAPAKTPITIDFEASKQWIAPGTEITLKALNPADGLKFRWQYGLRKGDGGTLDTGIIDAGKSGDLTLDKEGSYLLHCHPHPWMKMTIHVAADATTSGIAHVAILDDGQTDTTFRFEPAELTVAPGTTITFWNNGTMVHTATLEKYNPPLTDIPGEGGEVTFAFPAAGDYRVVLTVTDAGTGFGQAEKRVLVDENAPSDVFAQTFTGEMLLAVSDDPATQVYADGVKAHAFKLDYAGALTATIASTTDTPVPHQVQISLIPSGKDQPLAQSQPGTDGTFTIDVPAGSYVLEVRGLQGAQVKYTATVNAILEIPLPPEGTGDEHGGHGGGGHHH